MTNSQHYEDHYKQLSLHVALVTRSWHYYLRLYNRAAEENDILEALNKAPRFWQDQKYFLIQTTLIFLGRIFDIDDRSYSVDKTINSAKENKAHFTKLQRKARKLKEAGGDYQGLEEYVQQTSELNDEDIKVIQRELRKAKKIWVKLEPIRNKIYAHAEIITDEQKQKLFGKVTNGDITKLIQLLNNISNSLWEADVNGRKPDFSQDYSKPIKWAQNDTDELIKALVGTKL